ncbi:hypothetical protein, partial [Aminipila sp.]|uniref:hypothetical protein n=1 Tax=Aminipila sp. TaxID=2060095 RepID=UPI00289ADC6E
KVLSHRPHFSTKQGVRRSVIRNFFILPLFRKLVNVFLHLFALFYKLMLLTFFIDLPHGTALLDYQN